jgi:hypothetical protein
MNNKDNTYYLIHVYQDRELMKHIRSVGNNCKTKKDAVKLMKNEAHNDIVRGNYYFYHVQQHKTETIEIYPSQETTGDIE